MHRFASELAAACRALMRRPGAALSALLSLGLTVGALALVATWYETFVGFRSLASKVDGRSSSPAPPRPTARCGACPR